MFFLVVNLASSFSPTNRPNPLQCVDRYSLSQTTTHSSLQSLSLMVFAFVAASLCWPPPQSLLFGWLENLSKKTHIDHHVALVLLRSLSLFFSLFLFFFSFFFFFFFLSLLLAWCLVLGVWVVRKCGKAKEIYIYYYFGMFFDYINDFFFFFCLVFGCWENVGR